MNYREIPENAVEIQPGLWWSYQPFEFGGNMIAYGELYASEGYCFYELNRAENYDSDGDLLPAEELIYEIYRTCLDSTEEAINARIVSVPYQPGYNVLTTPNDPPSIA